MSDDGVRYIFKIESMTPETMPFGRLIEYYSEIKNMIGNAESLFLVEIREGSHQNSFKVDHRQRLKVDQRMVELRTRSAPRHALRALDNINKMLSQDHASGSFADQSETNVIQFPGRGDEASRTCINDVAAFSGELYHISGSKGDVKVRMQTDQYGVVYCTTTRALAKELRGYLFEEVKVTGRGAWVKQRSDNWTLENFAITEFTPVRKESVREAVNRIRSIDLDWPSDPIGELRALDGRDGQVQ